MFQSIPVQIHSSADLNRRPFTALPEKGVCSDSNRTLQPLQEAARKSLETISGMILNRERPKFVTKTVANEKRGLNFESHVDSYRDLP